MLYLVHKLLLLFGSDIRQAHVSREFERLAHSQSRAVDIELLNVAGNPGKGILDLGIAIYPDFTTDVPACMPTA